MSETNGGQRARSRSSSSSSSSSSDDENKNLTKEEKKQRKKEKKLLKKQKRKERGRSSSSSSSSSDEEYKNLSKDEKKKRKKEKKAMKKKQKEAKKEEAKPIAEAKPIQGVTAQKADVNVPTAQDSGGVAKADAEASKGRGQDDDSETASQGKQKKEYKTEELRRLQEILKKERSHIRKPRQRAHFPFVWTSLEPYYNTQTAAFLIDLPEEFRHSYLSRNTAQGLCDPWIDLRMDHDILPKISSGTRTSTRGSHSQEKSKEKKKEKEAKEKEKEKKPFEGSTRLPKFPVVPFHAGKENATQRFPYQDIPKFRQEMDQRFSLHAPKKIEEDYKRTKEDFYRMELDRLDQVHPMNRPHMRKAYFAYLQNTPGSKKAITECVRSLDGSPQQQKSGSAQKVN